MKRTIAVAASWLFLATPAFAAQNPPDKTTQSHAELLTNGRITKIDNKKLILTVRNEAEGSAERRNPSPDPGSGGRYPGRRRQGGVGFPGGRFPGGGGYPGGGYPGGGGRRAPAPAQKDQGKEFKVYVKDDTAINDSDKRLSFSNLVVGDRITIQGLPKGKGDDLEASKITLNH
jgi:hypothetical protein